MGDSPAKKLDFKLAGKENVPINTPAPIMDDLEAKKPITEVFDEKKKDTPAVVSTIKKYESDEPLLQENPHRFVLFPIKYHEVRIYLPRETRKVVFDFSAKICLDSRYGKCTRKLRHLSGQPRRLIFPRISMIGMIG